MSFCGRGGSVHEIVCLERAKRWCLRSVVEGFGGFRVI